ncbi:MAG: alpha-2-macroglobulin family protein, partial [Bacteroidales bacterium]
MRHNFLNFFFLFFLLHLTQSCTTDQNNAQPPLNDYVAEFTSGVVSRKTTVEVILNDPLSPEQQKPEFLQQAFSITPRIQGRLEVADDKRLLFKPKGMFEPGKKYTITWDLNKFFKTNENNKQFTFSFETIKSEISFRLNEMNTDLHSFRDSIYEFRGTLLLSDWSDSATIHDMIEFDTPVNIRWEKTGLSKSYDISFNAKTQSEKTREIAISTKKNKDGFPRKELTKVRVPGRSDFDVYSIELDKEREEFVCVTFTRTLAPDQDLTGLIEVTPGEDVSYSIEDNKAKIWFQDKNIANREITIHDGIRAFYGNRTLVKKTDAPNRYHRVVSFTNNYPSLEFIGQGGILPQGDNLIVPFSATNLRGVIVRIIKVYSNNIHQFLQRNQLPDNNELAAMGELLCRKIIFLDERGDYDLNQRNTFALDMKELIKTEPGALYRVILSYNYELSAYPCDGIVKKTKRELIAENKKLEEQEKANFGNGNAYYYFSDQSWENYNWEKRNMPCEPSYYVNKQISKNILHSDLGIIAKRGDRGKMFVAVNNLLTAEPEGDVSVSVYTYNNQEIGKQTTWENGTSEFDLKSKEPFFLIAQKGKQKGYLRMAPGENLSMSAFDVSGEEVKNGTKGFIYAERGVWRPGDTLFVSFILNNPYGDLPERHPVTFELFTPSGQLYWHKSLSTRADNFYVFKPATSPESPTGVWNGKITVGGISFEKKFRIESIKPNRMSLDLSFENEILKRDSLIRASLHAQWLTGATASSLNYDIYLSLVPFPTKFKGFKDYVFEDPTRKFSATDILFSKGHTNAKGSAEISTVMKQGGFAPGLLRAQFLTKVYEESGEFSINTIQKIYSPFSSYVGISSPQKNEDALSTNKSYQFDIASVSAEGNPVGSQEIELKIFKVEWYWWWSSDMSRVADYVSSSYNKPVRVMKLKTNNNGETAFSLKIPSMDWGTYYIQANNTTSGHQSGIMAYFDSYEEGLSNRNPERAMLLSLDSEKDNYAPGDEVVIRFPSTAQSKAIITIEASGGILQHHEINCQDKNTAFRFKATREMQPNIYVSVTLLNPYASTENDLPIRLYGVIPVKIYDKSSVLTPVIEAPESVRPGSVCKIKVSEKKGLPMTYTLALVDEGLLDLTNFHTPSPWDAFFAKEALGMRTWDMYNYVLGAYGGKIEQIFSIGGDDALNKGPKAIVNRFKPMVRFVGPITLKAKEVSSISVKIPDYMGKVRCMVIAGNNDHQYGHAQQDIFVKQPLMVLGTLPRQLNTGDEIWVPATVFVMNNNISKVNVSLEVNDSFTVIGSNTQEVLFDKQGSKVVWFKVKAKDVLKPGHVRILVTGDSERASWQSDISIVSPIYTEKKAENFILKAGESKEITTKPF